MLNVVKLFLVEWIYDGMLLWDLTYFISLEMYVGSRTFNTQL